MPHILYLSLTELWHIFILDELELKKSLTVVALDRVDVHRGIKLSGAKEAAKVEGVPRAVRRGSKGAGERSSTHPIILILLLLSSSLHLHLFLLCPLHIMDAHQQTVVHDLQGGKELTCTHNSNQCDANARYYYDEWSTHLPTQSVTVIIIIVININKYI